METKSERDLPSTGHSTMNLTARAGPDRDQEPTTLSGYLTWVAGACVLCHHLMPSQVHLQEAVLKVEQLGFEPVLRYRMLA